MVEKLTAEQAAEWISDNDAVMFGGFIGSVVPEAIERAIGERYDNSASPKGLTLVFAAGQGDGKDRALNHIAKRGLVSRVIGGHWGLVPKLQQMAIEEQIQGYNLPQGIISHLLRDTAAGKIGTFSKVGLDTFVDPTLEGGRINAVTTEEWVQRIELFGEPHLFYKKLPVDVAILRGTTADEFGNITMEDECLIVESLAAAQAAKNSGGRVIVQVKQMVKGHRLDPHAVKIPAIFVDAVVVCGNEKEHMQTFASQMNPAFVGRLSDLPPLPCDTENTPLDAKTIIARRAAMELQQGAILNLGIGVPEYIAQVAKQAGVIDQFTLTVEPGAVGGFPASGLDFGASSYPDAIISQDQMFDFYDGGGIDQAFLGLAQCDGNGDINVSRFGNKIAGCGGFINITQNAKQLFFCGTFTAQGLKIKVTNKKLVIEQEGRERKFLSRVQQITFSAKQAKRQQKPVLYITERAIFSLQPEGLMLEEIAPGVDIERDIVAHMEFVPSQRNPMKIMDSSIFEQTFLLRTKNDRE